MHLIQLLIPLYDNEGQRFPAAHYEQVRDELVEAFGGLTVYARAPVNGLWQEEAGRTVHDDLVIYEVMAPSLDRHWWQEYRLMLEGRFLQDALVVRANEIQIL